MQCSKNAVPLGARQSEVAPLVMIKFPKNAAFPDVWQGPRQSDRFGAIERVAVNHEVGSLGV